MKANPPWLTDLIGDFWDTLEGKVPPEWLPKLSDVRGSRGKVVGELKEYGCGSYGCVVPTQSPDVVMKATTDASEIEYAAHLSHTVPVEVTTEYFLVVGLSAKIEGRPVALLWRESADHVGDIQRSIPRGKKAVSLIVAQHKQASRILLGHSKGLGAGVMQPLLAGWLATLDAMAEIDELRFVALGMKQCFAEQGILFLDVHEGNLGRVLRDGQHVWVITDPGNVVRMAGTPTQRGQRRRTNPAPSWAQSEHEIAGFEREVAVREALIESGATVEDGDVFSTMSPVFSDFLRSNKISMLSIPGVLHRIVDGEVRFGNEQWVVVRANPYSAAWPGQVITPSPLARDPQRHQSSSRKMEPTYEPGAKVRAILDGACAILDEHWRAGATNARQRWTWDTLFAGTVGFFVLYLDLYPGEDRRNFLRGGETWHVQKSLVPAPDLWLREGMRVRTRRTIDRFPDFSVPSSSVGVLQDVDPQDDRNAYISMTLDAIIPGAAEWDNQVIWSANDVYDMLEGDDPDDMEAAMITLVALELEPEELREYAPFDPASARWTAIP